MNTLGNGALAVELVDPVADKSLLGSRFCWGGYIWQIRDAEGRELLAGSQWPEAAPDPFDGQGLPEVLRHSELITGRPLTHSDGRGLVLGAGLAEWGEDGPVITEPAKWFISREDDTWHYCTGQAGYGWGADVNRSIALDGTTVTLKTSVTCTGTRRLPLQWFAHPFFPLRDGCLEVSLPPEVGIEENPGFAIIGGRLSFKRVFHGAKDGHFQALQVDGRRPLSVEITHPVVGNVRMETSFPPDQLYVWANGNTFSIEPYMLTELVPGEQRSWWVKYWFGDGTVGG